MDKFIPLSVFTFLLLSLSSCHDKLYLEPEKAKPETFEIGDSHEGGTVFYVDATGQHGLVAASTDLTMPILGAPIADNSISTSTISVSGVPGTAASAFKGIFVNLIHSYDHDITLALQAPDGSIVVLSSANGASNNDYTNTCFTISATTSITSGVPPYTGSYIPQQSFSLFNASPCNGTWTLTITDNAAGDTGELFNWRLAFTNAGFSAPNNSTAAWYNGTFSATGVTNTSNGSGGSNTDAIVSQYGTGYYAADLCATYSGSGSSNWHLPSLDELTLMYGQRSMIGGFITSPYFSGYWSSSEASSSTAKLIDFSSGTVINESKDAIHNVRAIHSF